MRFSMRRRATNKRRCKSTLRQPLGAFTKTCLIKGISANAISPNTLGLVGTSRQAATPKVSRVNSSLMILM